MKKATTYELVEPLKNPKTLTTVYIFAITLSTLSDQLYINLGSSILTFYSAIAIPLLILTIINGLPPIASNHSTPIYAIAFILALYVIAGVIYSKNINLLIQIIPYTITPILFLHIGYYAKTKTIAKTLFILIILCGATATAQTLYLRMSINGPYGIYQSITEHSISIQLELLDRALYGRAVGIFSDPNTLGLFGGASLWLMATLKGTLSKAKYTLSIYVSAALIIFSMSRGSLSGIIISLAIFTALNPQKISPSLIASVTAIALLTYFFIDDLPLSDFSRLLEIFHVITGGAGESENLAGRISAWEIISDYVTLNIMGTITPPILTIGQSPDNQFIYFLAQGGYFLAIAYTASMIFIFASLTKSKSPYNQYFACAFLFYTINSLTMPTTNNPVAALFWLTIGVSMKHHINARKVKNSEASAKNSNDQKNQPPAYTAKGIDL